MGKSFSSKLHNEYSVLRILIGIFCKENVVIPMTDGEKNLGPRSPLDLFGFRINIRYLGSFKREFWNIKNVL